MRPVLLIIVPVGLLLGGCVVRAAADVVTFPVRAVSAGVDAVTTSQEEADRNRGRELRKQEEREARERKRAEKERRRQRDDATEPPYGPD